MTWLHKVLFGLIRFATHRPNALGAPSTMTSFSRHGLRNCSSLALDDLANAGGEYVHLERLRHHEHALFERIAADDRIVGIAGDEEDLCARCG